MGTVVINSVTYTILGEHTGAGSATEYLGAALHATAWAAASSDDQKKALVSATRTFDRMEWSAAYDTHAERDAVLAIKQASWELAAQLLVDAQGAAGAGGNVQTIAAKGLAITFFSPRVAGELPVIVMDLIVDYLARTAGGYGTPFVSGDGEKTEFEASGADAGKYDRSDASG